MAVDPRLPKIIFLRKQGKTLREVGKACELSEGAVRKILSKCARKSLRDCGLRRK
jgi:DNA-directed RNA polymerase sigma subunit (sigma70/sigma32)